MENILLSNILDTDSYKLSHWTQYPPNTTEMESYFESRGGLWRETVFFGLQYYLKKFLSQPITVEMVEEAREFAALHGEPFNYEGWLYIAKDLKGKLPIRIKAVPEGSVVPVSNVLFKITSTDEKAFWVVSWVETMLVRLWYPITVATLSYQCKKLINSYLEKTADDPAAELSFKLHDFGSRGASCQESAMIGGAAHLVNFMGSDTIAGIWMANKFYGVNGGMAGFSIPASEHSTMTMWGKENENKAMENMIKQYGNGPIFACVSDSWNIYNAVENIWGNELRQKVLDMNATLVVRPDSGEPAVITLECLQGLERRFGFTVNSKGYKVLNKVRVIQGDGNNYEIIAKTLELVSNAGYSITNVAFGMGGGLLQAGIDRDTQKFAFKCSWAVVDGREVEVHKEPIHGGKKSKQGRLALMRVGNNVATVVGDSNEDMLETVYENGEIIKTTTFDEVRERTNTPLGVYKGWTDRRA